METDPLVYIVYLFGKTSHYKYYIYREEYISSFEGIREKYSLNISIIFTTYAIQSTQEKFHWGNNQIHIYQSIYLRYKDWYVVAIFCFL